MIGLSPGRSSATARVCITTVVLSICVTACGGSQPDATTQTVIPLDQLETPPTAHISSIPLLESRLATYMAGLIAPNQNTLTPARLAAQTKRLLVTCASPQFGQIPCVVSKRATSQTVNTCTVPVSGVDQLERMRCAGPTGQPPITRPGYVDCATLGLVATSTGAASNTLSRHSPWPYLTEARISATSSTICVDFRTAARTRVGETLSFTVLPLQAGTPVEHNALAGELAFVGGWAIPEVEDALGRPTSGKVGTIGDWTSLVVRAGDLIPSVRSVVRPFQFQASARYKTAEANHTPPTDYR